MKKTVSILLAAGLLAAAPWSASAGGRGGGYSGHGGGYYSGHGGYGVGAFFAGLIGGAILTTVIAGSQPAVAYALPPAYVPPPPPQVWVPGRYEVRVDRQWIPGHWEFERYSRHRDDDDDGYRGGRKVWVPGQYRDVQVQVWVPGHWEERG
ncbi:MAG TPA: hypothetical protein VF853_02455 [Candidatus Deferrimicrobiaceae bacterium]